MRETRTLALTTEASALPRVSPDDGWLLAVALGALGAGGGAPGLWLYCRDTGEGAPAPLPAATAPLPLNVDIGGRDAALVTAEPRIGAAVSPLGDIAEYA